MKLSELEVGKKAKVIKINLNSQIGQRLSNLGLTVGVDVCVLRYAPFGDPIEIRLRNFCLAIRRQTAENIMVIEYE